LKQGNHIPGWMFHPREEPFGYWSDKWYYNNQLIYLEEFNDYYGRYAMDYTTYEVWYSSNREPEIPLQLNNEWTFENTTVPFIINENS
jgi:hypothetical protein